MSDIERERVRREQELDMAVASAMQQVCFTMAMFGGLGAASIRDTDVAAKSLADSHRWSMAGAMCGLGRPDLVIKFIKETK